ncbi:Ldh family oxidoreductase [Micrococcales bacterium 31B]|nr:Ldh family oxidoreductase [Micrococcales bacterium 31B]
MTTVNRDVDELRAQAAHIIEAHGSAPDEARIVADSLVAADARGIHSHGLLRLPLYMRAVECGGIVANAEMTWVHETGAVAQLDAGSGFGQVAMHRAVERARALCASHGIAAIAVRNSTHYGAGAYWSDALAHDGLFAQLVSTTGNSVAPFGSAEKLLGTNPFSLSFPTPDAPITADLATSAGAYGKIVQSANEGKPIPEGWALDAAGAPTIDASAALAGSLLPFGGPKGSAISVLIELLAGAAAGGRFAHETVDMWQDQSSQMGTGALLIALDVRAVNPSEDALARAAGLRSRLRDARPAQGFDAVLAPGDIELGREASGATSLELPANIDEGLRELAAKVAA